jgi:hypothetical protein
MIAATHRKRILGHFRKSILRVLSISHLKKQGRVTYSPGTTSKQGIMKGMEANFKLVRLIRDLESDENEIARIVAGKILDEVLSPPKQEYTLEEPLGELDRS